MGLGLIVFVVVVFFFFLCFLFFFGKGFMYSMFWKLCFLFWVLPFVFGCIFQGVFVERFFFCEFLELSLLEPSLAIPGFFGVLLLLPLSG